MKHRDYVERLRQDPEYVAAEEELRPYLDLADDVLDLRLENGWTQAEVARRAGTRQPNISRIEDGRANPTLKFLHKLAKALGARLVVHLESPVIGDVSPSVTLQNDADYEAALAEIDRLFNAEPGTPEGARLEVLMILVEAYEDEHCPVPLPDPIDAIKYHMESRGLSSKDLEPCIGSPAWVSEVLDRRRALTLQMIRDLETKFGIPAEILIQPYELAGRGAIATALCPASISEWDDGQVGVELHRLFLEVYRSVCLWQVSVDAPDVQETCDTGRKDWMVTDTATSWSAGELREPGGPASPLCYAIEFSQSPNTTYAQTFRLEETA
jgi:HTH-type transcriptional regulator/antitoxin HigA